MDGLATIQEIYLSAPEEAVFLERAKILQETRSKFVGAPPGVRQGKTIQELCDRVSVVVSPDDVLLGRILEQAPDSDDEKFIREHPELFLEAGVPGWLDSDSLYIPDWNRLLEKGLPGLAAEVEARRRETKGVAADAREWTTCWKESRSRSPEFRGSPFATRKKRGRSRRRRKTRKPGPGFCARRTAAGRLPGVRRRVSRKLGNFSSSFTWHFRASSAAGTLRRVEWTSTSAGSTRATCRAGS